MASVTGDIVPNPGGELPFKVVFKHGETVLTEWEVKSKEEGEEQMVEFIKEAAEAEDDD